MGCKYENGGGCLNCELEKCILDKEVKDHKDIPEPKKPDRKEYYHLYYKRRKMGQKKIAKCNFCGNEIHGEAYRLGKYIYCGFNCMMCRLWDENEKRMQIVNI